MALLESEMSSGDYRILQVSFLKSFFVLFTFCSFSNNLSHLTEIRNYLVRSNRILSAHINSSDIQDYKSEQSKFLCLYFQLHINYFFPDEAKFTIFPTSKFFSIFFLIYFHFYYFNFFYSLASL